MYIPRPAKLSFTVDDGWNLFINKSGDSAPPWIRLCVKLMPACVFYQSCKPKTCSSCGFKAPEQWMSQQSHIPPDCDWQHITFTMPHLIVSAPPGSCCSGTSPSL